jgi:hypothetical protein
MPNPRRRIWRVGSGHPAIRLGPPSIPRAAARGELGQREFCRPTPGPMTCGILPPLRYRCVGERLLWLEQSSGGIRRGRGAGTRPSGRGARNQQGGCCSVGGWSHRVPYKRHTNIPVAWECRGMPTATPRPGCGHSPGRPKQQGQRTHMHACCVVLWTLFALRKRLQRTAQ